jgi:DNA-binding GntR family transcriptional regulator
MVVTSNTLVLKKLNELNRRFEKETCASTRNMYLWPFITQQMDQNCFYRRKRRGKLLFPMSREQERHYDGRKAKFKKKVTSRFLE